MAKIRKAYPYYASEEVIYERLFKVFEEIKKHAINEEKSFAMETNFSSSLTDLKELIDEFKQNGYQTNIYYLGLDSIQKSNLRVAERVSNGGHSVTPGSIKYNYEKGIEYVNHCLHLFDNVSFIDNRGLKITEIATIREATKTILVTNPPEWFSHFVSRF